MPGISTGTFQSGGGGLPQLDVLAGLLGAFEAVVYVLKVLPERGNVLFYLLRILFAYDDSFHELGDFSHLTLLHAQPGYLGGPLYLLIF